MRACGMEAEVRMYLRELRVSIEDVEVELRGVIAQKQQQGVGR